ncbi:MAG: hypothetical protein JWO64_3056, partial [Hyphomicrobiales bacterium]|nr:hypothetical protein [Hyphomicrobiales bacterium]
MTTRNLLLAGTIVAGPLLSLLIPNGAARAESGQMLRMAQAEPTPAERRERAAPPQAAPQAPAPQQREAPPQPQPPRA